ncbi:glutamine amidotransferase [Solobacterium sp.]|uniref:type 1 glutamine amidotransferase n=1 Tax=Solobacterium sp. TaxID=2060878 RepID=UPI001CB4D3B3|nr:glutamine amidotransferase [Solobacterium sp.]MBF1086044.1 glutamine amidotransferase [Solobacterium sp.]MBF1090125.1 glutamine amidotransferase [Solobacterium sp.]
MELKILWMYHDLMDLYGDKGNIETLRYRASKRGINVVVDTCTLQEKRNIEDYDIFFLGGGADKEQTLIYKDLLARKESILKAKESGTAFLLICGGYQLFGQYYLDQDGQKIDGLGIYDYYTESSDRDHRCIGNIVVKTNIHDKEVTVVGFENHGGQTKAVSNPFGKVLVGHGNTYKGKYEGYMDAQTIATYMHGPLLPKNPAIADEVILRGLNRRYAVEQLEQLQDTLENAAHDAMLKRLNVK